MKQGSGAEPRTLVILGNWLALTGDPFRGLRARDGRCVYGTRCRGTRDVRGIHVRARSSKDRRRPAPGTSTLGTRCSS
jgi:hypothetical protein